MWTARNRQGFLGVTCFFLDKDFVIQEIVLTIEYVKYPHTAQNISDALLNIIDQWKIKSKVFKITTDNGANMKKAVKIMNSNTSNIKWQSCAAHTLQLVIGKGLNPIKLLVLRTKRLIDFFLRPKQSERLENIQKSSQNIIDVVRNFIYNLYNLLYLLFNYLIILIIIRMLEKPVNLYFMLLLIYQLDGTLVIMHGNDYLKLNLIFKP
jgi:hypothetical protein